MRLIRCITPLGYLLAFFVLSSTRLYSGEMFVDNPSPSLSVSKATGQFIKQLTFEADSSSQSKFGLPIEAWIERGHRTENRLIFWSKIVPFDKNWVCVRVPTASGVSNGDDHVLRCEQGLWGGTVASDMSPGNRDSIVFYVYIERSNKSTRFDFVDVKGGGKRPVWRLHAGQGKEK